jgi:hypothetical protein
VLAQKDESLYAGLVAVAEDGLRAGEKTVSDVDTLVNSKRIAALDAKIFSIEIQEKFLELYAKMSDEI